MIGPSGELQHTLFNRDPARDEARTPSDEAKVHRPTESDESGATTLMLDRELIRCVYIRCDGLVTLGSRRHAVGSRQDGMCGRGTPPGLPSRFPLLRSRLRATTSDCHTVLPARGRQL